MKIAMFTDTYTPQINGVVTSIRMSAEELTRRGHEVFIFAPDFEKTQITEGNVIRLPSTGYPIPAMKEFQITRGYNSVVRQLRSLEIELIHSHDPGSMGLKAVPMSRYLKIPHIHTYHTFWPDYVHYIPLGGSRYTKMTAERFSALFCNRCDGIIAPTKKIQDALTQYGTRVPIEIVPTGIRTEGFPDMNKQALYEKFNIPRDRKILVYAGRVVKEKNVPFLLNMMRHLVQRMEREEFHLILLGDGREKEPLMKEAAATGLEGHITFAGFRPHREVMEIFHLSDLFVFASVTETQGLVLLEAMASGIPAVVVDALGIGDIMADGRGGFPVPEDEEAFARTVTELLDNRELYEKKQAEALEKAEEFSISRCTERLEEFYETTLMKYKPREQFHRMFYRIRRRDLRHRKGELPPLEEVLGSLFREPSGWRNRYFMMRHGQSQANEQGVIVSHFSNGLSGFGLTAEGRRQIELSLREQSVLDSDTVIVSSDFLRTRETAEVAAGILGTQPPRTSVLLRERYFGRYEEREDIYYSMVWQMDEKSDRNSEYGVESPEEVQERIQMLIHQLEEEYSGKTILLISHGDPLQIAQTWTEGVPAGLHRSLSHLKTGEIRELKPAEPAESADAAEPETPPA